MLCIKHNTSKYFYFYFLPFHHYSVVHIAYDLWSNRMAMTGIDFFGWTTYPCVDIIFVFISSIRSFSIFQYIHRCNIGNNYFVICSMFCWTSLPFNTWLNGRPNDFQLTKYSKFLTIIHWVRSFFFIIILMQYFWFRLFFERQPDTGNYYFAKSVICYIDRVTTISPVVFHLVRFIVNLAVVVTVFGWFSGVGWMALTLNHNNESSIRFQYWEEQHRVPSTKLHKNKFLFSIIWKIIWIVSPINNNYNGWLTRVFVTLRMR